MKIRWFGNFFSSRCYDVEFMIAFISDSHSLFLLIVVFHHVFSVCSSFWFCLFFFCSQIIKTFTFQFVNSYLPLFFIAFLSTKTTNPSRIQDLFAQLLVILLLKQIIGNILELLIPYVKTCLARRKDLANARKMGEENVELSQLDRENSLEPYETPFDDYLQIGILGFFRVSLFLSFFLSLLSFVCLFAFVYKLYEYVEYLLVSNVGVRCWMSVVFRLIFSFCIFQK